MAKEVDFSTLKEQVITEIIGAYSGSDEITIITQQGDIYTMYHSQDCCERVSINDIEGDINDLLNSPILQADESTNSEDTFGKIEYPESFTWTFYKLATIKGYVTIRWLGESNGYYSERVDFVKQ